MQTAVYGDPKAEGQLAGSPSTDIDEALAFTRKGTRIMALLEHHITKAHDLKEHLAESLLT
jgi:hypothetical protein